MTEAAQDTLHEIALMHGLHIERLNDYRYHPDFPKPKQRIKNADYYFVNEVSAFIKTHGIKPKGSTLEADDVTRFLRRQLNTGVKHGRR